MNRALFYFYFLLIIIVGMLGCSVKTKLSQTDLKWMNVYNEGDTLIFKSDKGEIDTTFITKKEIFYPEPNSIEVHGKYLPQWGIIWYKNANLINHPEGYRMVTIIKKHPKNETFLNIDYLYSDILVPNITTGGIEKLKKDRVYEFDTYHAKAKSEQPKKIFWHEDYGIIKYITSDNVMWERINLLK